MKSEGLLEKEEEHDESETYADLSDEMFQLHFPSRGVDGLKQANLRRDSEQEHPECSALVGRLPA